MSAKPFVELSLPEWTEFMREIVQRERHAVRAGEGATIEAKSLRTDQWLALNLPNGKPQFPTNTERDQALTRIQTP